ncbi:MAG: hypothetical protein ACK45Y_03030 [Betaproteobacteria bacterium]|jgi:hypothetical protein
MDTDEFVQSIKQYVLEAATNNSLTNLASPPGRRVLPAERMRSDWYNGLPEKEAEYVREIVAYATHSAIFGLFAVLDGSRVIVDDKDARFELTYVSGIDETRILLNDPNGIGLNEVLNAVD